MKLQILQENLTQGLNLTSRFASARAQLPILGNVLILAKGNKLTVSSTNLEISASVSMGAKIEKEGEIAVPAKVIAELVGNLPKETINLVSEKEQLEVSSGSFSSKVLGMNTSDFPSVPTSLGKDSKIVLLRKDLNEAILDVLFSTSIDETRPILTGVLFIFAKDKLTLVATDGFRLSQKKLKVDELSLNTKIVIPKLILSELPRIEQEEDILSFKLQEKEKQIMFAAKDTILSSRLLEGEFPDYEKIIPKSASYKVRVDKEELERAVKLASIFAKDAANILKIKLFLSSIKVSAESSQSGSQSTKVEAKIEGNISKEGFEIAFNYKFLEDFLHAVGDEEINIEFSNTTSPGVFTKATDPSYLHLIMPVRVQG
ncbi:DNA polymerase III subunit beta [Patescibacteria group bacterium]